MVSSRRDILNGMAEHRPIMKYNQNTSPPRFGFTPKTGISFPETGFYIYFERWKSYDILQVSELLSISQLHALFFLVHFLLTFSWRDPKNIVIVHTEQHFYDITRSCNYFTRTLPKWDFFFFRKIAYPQLYEKITSRGMLLSKSEIQLGMREP